MPSTSFKDRKQNEVIGCKTCHVDYSWKRRAIAAVTVTYANSGATSTETVSYPDSGESNICLNCHTGRESGNIVKNLPATTNFTNKGFENSHYLTAGGTLFGKTGYTNFSAEGGGTRNYTLVDFNGDGITDFKHDLIGRTAAGTRTGKGPCVDCHMTNSANHRFSPVTQDGEGKVTAVVSTVCVNCHIVGTPYELTAAVVNGQKDQFADALKALNAQLEARGFYFFEKNPYFFNSAAGTAAVTNWVDASDSSLNGRLTGEQNMGAAFNYNLLKHDPGAYAHNRFYTKRLIYDAIDWLDDHTMNYSVGTTLNGLPAGTSYKANAIAYLLATVTPTGSAAERP